MNLQQELVIIGASGFGKEIAWLAEECGVTVRGFLDDNTEITGQFHYKYKILGTLSTAIKYPNCQFIVAIGDTRIRKKLVTMLMAINVTNFATLVHPSVKISKSVTIGKGTAICSGNILTVDIKIAEHCQINLATTIGHDVEINNYCTIAPQAIISGNVTIESGVEIGTGAAVRQGLTIQTGSLVGMGAVVLKTTNANEIYIGNPAKPFKKLEDF